MAEEFQAAVIKFGGSWWSSPSTTFNRPASFNSNYAGGCWQNNFNTNSTHENSPDHSSPASTTTNWYEAAALLAINGSSTGETAYNQNLPELVMRNNLPDGTAGGNSSNFGMDQQQNSSNFMTISNYDHPLSSNLLQTLLDATSSPPPQQPVYDFQANLNDLGTCWNIYKSGTIEDVGDMGSSYKKKTNSSHESIFKRPRLETPSPLPTFKVRKEKLGDRVTALQQLVSPFGKTDTASVLQEAVEYIKLLHDQVDVLSNPYMKDGATMQVELQTKDKVENKKEEGAKGCDLRSRGLCLVPVSSTFPVATEIAPDYWTSSFINTF